MLFPRACTVVRLPQSPWSAFLSNLLHGSALLSPLLRVNCPRKLPLTDVGVPAPCACVAIQRYL